MTELWTSAHREFVYLWYYFELQFRQIFRYWMIGILIGSCISVFLKDRIHGLFRQMSGSKFGVLGLVPASLLGIASPLCMYGTIPLAASVSRSGMRDDWLAAFMMTSILLNPQLIIYSVALGRAALTVRIISCFLCGIAAGLLVRLFFRNKEFFDFRSFDEPKSRDTDPDLLIRPGGEQRISNFLLWQCAYSEFYFTDVLWPDFSTEELDKAIETFRRRDRRYGGVKT